MPALGETFSSFCVYSGSCPLLLWSPRLALLGLAERHARLSSSGQAIMEIARLLHAAFINGLSGPIFFPTHPQNIVWLPTLKRFLVLLCKTPLLQRTPRAGMPARKACLLLRI